MGCATETLLWDDCHTRPWIARTLRLLSRRLLTRWSQAGNDHNACGLPSRQARYSVSRRSRYAVSLRSCNLNPSGVLRPIPSSPLHFQAAVLTDSARCVEDPSQTDNTLDLKIAVAIHLYPALALVLNALRDPTQSLTTALSRRLRSYSYGAPKVTKYRYDTSLFYFAFSLRFLTSLFYIAFELRCRVSLARFACRLRCLTDIHLASPRHCLPSLEDDSGRLA